MFCSVEWKKSTVSNNSTSIYSLLFAISTILILFLCNVHEFIYTLYLINYGERKNSNKNDLKPIIVATK